MRRRTFLRGASAATLTTLASTGAAATWTVEPGTHSGRLVAIADCNCDGTYEACCVDGPCNCRRVRAPG